MCPDALGAFLVREDDQEAVVAFHPQRRHDEDFGAYRPSAILVVFRQIRRHRTEFGRGNGIPNLRRDL